MDPLLIQAILIIIIFLSLALLFLETLIFMRTLGRTFEILDVELRVLSEDNYMGLREISQFYTYYIFVHVPLLSIIIVDMVFYTLKTNTDPSIEHSSVFMLGMIVLFLLSFTLRSLYIGQKKIGIIMERTKTERILPLSISINNEIRKLRKPDKDLSQQDSEQNIDIDKLNEYIKLRDKLYGVKDTPINVRLIVIVVVQIIGGIIGLIISLLNFFI